MKKRAFTLTEMMFVVAMLTVLFLTAQGQYFRAAKKSREIVLKSQLATVRAAARSMFADVGLYPDDLFSTDLSSLDLPAYGYGVAGLRSATARNGLMWHGPYLTSPSAATPPPGFGVIKYIPSRLGQGVDKAFVSSLTGNDSTGVPFASY